MINSKFIFLPQNLTDHLFQIAKDFATYSILEIEKNGIPAFIFPLTQRPFDTLLGDKACQIRAYLYTTLINKIKKRISLTEDEKICLGICHILSFNQKKEFDQFGMTVKINTMSGYIPNCNLSNKVRQELVNLARQLLAQKSLTFLQKQYEENFPTSSLNKELIKKSFLKRKSGESLPVVPCFVSTNAILQLIKKNNLSIVISVIHFENESSNEEVIFFQAKENQLFREDVPTKEQQEAAVIRFHGFTLNDSHLFKENIFDIEKIILACAADHQQLPDHCMPELILEEENLKELQGFLNLSKEENIFSNTYQEKTDDGYVKSTKKTAFCIQHVFVDTYENTRKEMFYRKEILSGEKNVLSK